MLISSLVIFPALTSMRVCRSFRKVVVTGNLLSLSYIQEVFEGIFDKTKKQIPFDMKDYTKKNTSIADYVWLPIEFKNEKPIIKWYDKWCWEDFN